MLTIEKIGGTSMSALQRVIENIILYEREGITRYNHVYVVSAFAGVTDMLLENKKTGKAGVYQRIERHYDFHERMEKVLEELKTINHSQFSLGLDVEAADLFIEKRVRRCVEYLDSLVNILSSGYVSKTGILQAAREILASIGETHSAYNLSNILQRMNITSSFIDLSGADDKRALTIDQRIKLAFKDLSLDDRICIVTGYTKGSDGIMREFDRGYSEVTFSKIAALLHPKEAIIHKEYHLSTADPSIVGIQNCVPVGFTNYDIADQLADVGMEAIHPKAAKPLEIAGINLRIKNTFEPSHPGTLITSEFICPKKRVEVITGTDKLLIIDVYDRLMVGAVGSDLKIMQIFSLHHISYTFKSTSANSISLVIWEKDFNHHLIKDLQNTFERVSVEKIALVCMLGSNIDQPGLLAKSALALSAKGITIKSAGFALRKVNIQFLVEREDFRSAIIALNGAMK
jgi:aspartate kinase